MDFPTFIPKGTRIQISGVSTKPHIRKKAHKVIYELEEDITLRRGVAIHVTGGRVLEDPQGDWDLRTVRSTIDLHYDLILEEKNKAYSQLLRKERGS